MFELPVSFLDLMQGEDHGVTWLYFSFSCCVVALDYMKVVEIGYPFLPSLSDCDAKLLC